MMLDNQDPSTDELSIGAFAAAVGLSVSALRFYADRHLLTPARVDSTTGYRFYTSDQLEVGRTIRDLRRMKMPMTEIERVLTLPVDQREAAIDTHLDALEDFLEQSKEIASTLGLDKTKNTEGQGTVLTAGQLGVAIDQVLPAAGVSDERPHLMCVLIEPKDGSVRLAATDGYRLAVRDLVPRRGDQPFRAVVAAASLRRLRPELSSQDEVTLGVEGRDFTIVGHHGDGSDDEALNLRCSLIPATFPDYERVLESSSAVSHSAVIDRQECLAALESFAGDDAVSVDFATGAVTFSRHDTTITVEAVTSGADGGVALNPRFAADAARQAVGSELIVETERLDRPVRFRSADDGTYTSLLMPIADGD